MFLILLISGVISPPLIWGILYSRIVDQYIIIDGEEFMAETKAEAQRHVLIRTLKSPILYLYLIFAFVIIVSTLIATDPFNQGWLDWYLST